MWLNIYPHMNTNYAIATVLLATLLLFLVFPKFPKSIVNLVKRGFRRLRYGKEEDFEMKKISDFNESEYTKEHFNIAMYSIQSDSDWNLKVDHSEIKFHKNISGSFVRVDFEYTFDSKGFFELRRAQVVTTDTAGSNYHLYGKPDNKTTMFLYKKYSEWKNETNDNEKTKVDMKLGTFNKTLGKSVGRERKLNELLKDDQGGVY